MLLFDPHDLNCRSSATFSLWGKKILVINAIAAAGGSVNNRIALRLL